MISLGSGMPAPSTFPIADVQLTLKDGTSLALGEQLTAQFGPALGVESVEPTNANGARIMLRFEKALVGEEVLGELYLGTR